MKHIRVRHTNCKVHCPICDGSLFACRICNGAEGTLTTECPGTIINEEKQNLIYNGKLDFINGKWIKKE